MTRYYFISFAYVSHDGDGVGANIIADENDHLNILKTAEWIREKMGADKVAITNFQEVSEEMYNANKVD